MRALLMGGQACVFYGAAEFSREVDLLILADSENFVLLQSALEELQAEPIAVPPLDADYLERGHAVHFRCQQADAAGLRVDLMSRLRGADSFETMWERRTTIEANGELIDLLALEDLVTAKKTQLDKDWPMIRRLVEQSYFQHVRPGGPVPEESGRLVFWLREMRTPELLLALVRDSPVFARVWAESRPVLNAARTGDLDAVARALAEEEQEERGRDRVYWEPLKRELEQLRRARRRLSDRAAYTWLAEASKGTGRDFIRDDGEDVGQSRGRSCAI